MLAGSPRASPSGALTPAGRREVTISRTGPGTTWAVVDMGPVKIDDSARSICNVGRGSVLVDIGNPHLVVLGPDPATVDVATLGAELEKAEPGGLNVEFVTLGPGPDTVAICGSGSGVGRPRPAAPGLAQRPPPLPSLGPGRPGGDRQPARRVGGRRAAGRTAPSPWPAHRARVATCRWEVLPAR